MHMHRRLKTFRQFFAFFMTACFITVFFPSTAQANSRYASIVVDAASGKVLSERHADKSLHPASLTKIMTMYMAFDALKSGKLKMRQYLPVSKYAASMVPSKLGLKPGTSIRVDHAIAALVTKSANDVAVVLAEAIGGTEENFGRMMTAKGRTLGMQRTVFRNASGLHDPEQISSARDMAVLARSLMYYHPEYYKYFSLREFTYAGVTYKNHNHLMGTYQGMDGIKTGYIRASGFNLVASAFRDGHRLIGVVFGGRTSKTRNNHMAMLLDNGFARADRLQLAQWQKTPPLPARKPVTPKIELAALDTAVEKNFGTQSDDKSAQFDMMGLITGEGDIDIETRKSVSAIAETKAGLRPVAEKPQQVAQTPQKPGWQIQIGAFTSKQAAENALNKAITTLKVPDREGISPRVLPLQTQRGTIYRARISGFSRDGAVRTCGSINNCIIVAAAQ